MTKEKTLDEALEIAMQEAEQATEDSQNDSTPVVEDVVVEDTTEAPLDEAAEGEKAPAAPVDEKVSSVKQDEAKGKNTPTFDAPASWRNDEKAMWKDVPLPVRAAIARRERENVVALNEANQKLATIQKEGGEVDRVLAPYTKTWSERGIRTAEAVAQTMARASYAYQNPRKFIEEFAQENGIDLTALNEGDTHTYQDPELKQALDRVNALEHKINQSTQSQAEASRAENARLVNSFADEVDANGERLRPNFDKVQGLMLPLVQQIKAQTPHEAPQVVLQKAYEMACRAHPDVWQEMRENMFVQSETQKVQKQAEAAKAARSKAISPSSSPLDGGVLREDMSKKSLDDAVEAAFAQFGGRI